MRTGAVSQALLFTGGFLGHGPVFCGMGMNDPHTVGLLQAIHIAPVAGFLGVAVGLVLQNKSVGFGGIQRVEYIGFRGILFLECSQIGSQIGHGEDAVDLTVLLIGLTNSIGSVDQVTVGNLTAQLFIVDIANILGAGGAGLVVLQNVEEAGLIAKFQNFLGHGLDDFQNFRPGMGCIVSTGIGHLALFRQGGNLGHNTLVPGVIQSRNLFRLGMGRIVQTGIGHHTRLSTGRCLGSNVLIPVMPGSGNHLGDHAVAAGAVLSGTCQMLTTLGTQAILFAGSCFLDGPGFGIIVLGMNNIDIHTAVSVKVRSLLVQPLAAAPLHLYGNSTIVGSIQSILIRTGLVRFLEPVQVLIQLRNGQVDIVCIVLTLVYFAQLVGAGQSIEGLRSGRRTDLRRARSAVNIDIVVFDHVNHETTLHGVQIVLGGGCGRGIIIGISFLALGTNTVHIVMPGSGNHLGDHAVAAGAVLSGTCQMLTTLGTQAILFAGSCFLDGPGFGIIVLGMNNIDIHTAVSVKVRSLLVQPLAAAPLHLYGNSTIVGSIQSILIRTGLVRFLEPVQVLIQLRNGQVDIVCIVLTLVYFAQLVGAGQSIEGLRSGRRTDLRRARSAVNIDIVVFDHVNHETTLHGVQIVLGGGCGRGIIIGISFLALGTNTVHIVMPGSGKDLADDVCTAGAVVAGIIDLMTAPPGSHTILGTGGFCFNDPAIAGSMICMDCIQRGAYVGMEVCCLHILPGSSGPFQLIGQLSRIVHSIQRIIVKLIIKLFQIRFIVKNGHGTVVAAILAQFHLTYRPGALLRSKGVFLSCFRHRLRRADGTVRQNVPVFLNSDDILILTHCIQVCLCGCCGTGIIIGILFLTPAAVTIHVVMTQCRSHLSFLVVAAGMVLSLTCQVRTLTCPQAAFRTGGLADFFQKILRSMAAVHNIQALAPIENKTVSHNVCPFLTVPFQGSLERAIVNGVQSVSDPIASIGSLKFFQVISQIGNGHITVVCIVPTYIHIAHLKGAGSGIVGKGPGSLADHSRPGSAVSIDIVVLNNIDNTTLIHLRQRIHRGRARCVLRRKCLQGK